MRRATPHYWLVLGFATACGGTTTLGIPTDHDRDGGSGAGGDGGTTVDAGGGSGGNAGSGGAASGGADGNGGTVVDAGTDASSSGGFGGSSGGGGDAGPTDVGPIPPGPQLCGGVECAPNQVCCLVSLTCFDPIANAGACTAPIPPGFDESTHCTSNADCEASEFCWVHNTSVCGGAGSCALRANCGGCYSSGCDACGCDGKTYPNMQTACLAGVSVLEGACGDQVPLEERGADGAAPRTLTRCGTDTHCPASERCCKFTGACFDPAVPALCRPPPEGTRYPCIDDRQCNGEPSPEFCAGVGCQGPGGCAVPDAFECTGLFDPVCGCDGNTFTNQNCAYAAGVRIASQGACP